MIFKILSREHVHYPRPDKNTIKNAMGPETYDQFINTQFLQAQLYN